MYKSFSKNAEIYDFLLAVTDLYVLNDSFLLGLDLIQRGQLLDENTNDDGVLLENGGLYR